LIRPETCCALEGTEAILFGASGAADDDCVPEAERTRDRLLVIRRKLDFFLKLRPSERLLRSATDPPCAPISWTGATS
jgi:isocitrate/isopropylmalate dehydrogenase